MFANLQRFLEATTELLRSILKSGVIKKAIFKVDSFVPKSQIKAKECRTHSLEHTFSKRSALCLNDFDYS